MKIAFEITADHIWNICVAAFLLMVAWMVIVTGMQIVNNHNLEVACEKDGIGTAITVNGKVLCLNNSILLK